MKKKTTLSLFLWYNLFKLITNHKEKNVIKVETTTEAIESKGGLLLAGKVAIKAGLRSCLVSIQKYDFLIKYHKQEAVADEESISKRHNA